MRLIQSKRRSPLGESPLRHFNLGDQVPGLVLGATAFFLLLLVGYPLLWLVLTSFGIPDDLSLSHIIRVFTDPRNLHPVENTLLLAVGCGVGSIFLGVPLAWATARTDMPARRAIQALVAMAYITPPYLTALAYIILLGPQAGYFNRLLRLFHLGPLDIFSMGGVIAVVTLHGFAYTYFLTYDALRSLDAPFSETARILGASPFAVLRRIVLPLVAPGITGGALLAAVQAMADFGPQAFLGLPARIVFLPTRIYGALGSYPPRWADTAAMSLVLILLTVAGLYAQRVYLERRSFVTVGGRGVRVERSSLGRWGWLALLGCLGIVFFSTIAPFGVLAAAAFSRNWTLPLAAGNLTLANFQTALITDQVSSRGVLNSFGLAAGAATVGTLLGLFVSYLEQRTQIRGRRLLDYLAGLPLGLPGTVMAFGMILAFIRPPFQFLYATIWIILAAYVARFVPLAVRTTSASLRQVDPVLEEAARITGASWGRTLVRILAPVLRSGLLTAWLLVFIPALSELSATILLYTSGTETISVAIFRLSDLGQFEPVAALAVFTIAVTLVAAGLLQWLGSRGGAQTVRELPVR
jgi:iron(III) transport system permease protein